MKVEETSILKSIPILVGFSNILFSLALLLHLPFLNFLLNLLICRDTSLIFFPLEGLMLKLKLPILWPPDAKNWLIGKDPDSGKDWRQEEKGTVEDEMVGWHHWLDAHGLEQASGVGDGQGSLACCSPWGHKESDTTEWLNWTELSWVVTWPIWLSLGSSRKESLGHRLSTFGEYLLKAQEWGMRVNTERLIVNSSIIQGAIVSGD